MPLAARTWSERVRHLSMAPRWCSVHLPLELDRLYDLARVVLLQRFDVISGRSHPALFIEEQGAGRAIEMNVFARQERLHGLVDLEESKGISGRVGHGDHLLADRDRIVRLRRDCRQERDEDAIERFRGKWLKGDVGLTFTLEEFLIRVERGAGRGVSLDRPHADHAPLRYLTGAIDEGVPAEGPGRVPCAGALQWTDQPAKLGTEIDDQPAGWITRR